MRAVLLLGGDPPARALLEAALKDGAPLVCADGGLDAAYAYGFTPAVAIGDFDSASHDALAFAYHAGASVIKLSAEKDDTDGVAALDAALRMGASQILILGAAGGRLDHLLANTALLARAYLHGARAAILDGLSATTYRTGEAVVFGKPGALLSILPVGSARIAATEGLYYPMRDKTLEFAYPLGVSNVLTAERAVVRMECGACLFVKTPAPAEPWDAV